MSAIFDFSSLITVFVLSICTTTYLRELRPAIFDVAAPAAPNDATGMNDMKQRHHRDGIMGFLWKLSRIGERCSPYISVACILQALNILFWK
jgi:Protein of unknown function (DUF1242)